MNIPDLSNWPRSCNEAKAIQQQLAQQVNQKNYFSDIKTVAGVDVGFKDTGATTHSAVAVLNFPTLTLKEQATHQLPTCFPYVPGYLSFREIPAVIGALAKLETLPDLLLCDGQGLAHPRRFGIACHLGVLLDIPTIGVAKSRLIGEHIEPAADKGAHVPLMDKGEIIGAVLRTRSNVSPLYISIGHHIDLPTAIDYVLRCTSRYRLPETTRHAHRLASG